MNKELFRSMQGQMKPNEEARKALAEKLAAGKKRTVPVGRYAAIAACAAVIVGAVMAYQSAFGPEYYLTGSGQRVSATRPHSYTVGPVSAENGCWPEDTGAPEENSISTGGAGDQDQDMTPGELTDNMLESGFTQEDVDAYLASGWQMTWAKWWKFYHQAEENGAWTLEALLDFSRTEMLAVNTGEADIPGGAYVGGMPDQGEAVMAYQNLMDRFKADYGPDRYPEWYGGAYIDKHAGLIINIVADYESEDKELFFQILDWAGSDRVGFGSCRLSMNQLKDLQDNVITAMEKLGLEFGCGIDEEAGQVELTLPEAAMDALWELARLDPTDTAIRVIVGQAASADGLAEEPVMVAPSVSHSIQPGGDNDLPGMVVDADGVIAYEPQG